MSKTNTEHLRDILEKFELEPTGEALEFLDEIEEEINDLEKEKKNLENELSISQTKIEELTEEVGNLEQNLNENFVGLDTVRWQLDKGNLKIQMQMERFIETLQKQNCVSTTA